MKGKLNQLHVCLRMKFNLLQMYRLIFSILPVSVSLPLQYTLAKSYLDKRERGYFKVKRGSGGFLKKRGVEKEGGGRGHFMNQTNVCGIRCNMLDRQQLKKASGAAMMQGSFSATRDVANIRQISFSLAKGFCKISQGSFFGSKRNCKYKARIIFSSKGCLLARQGQV